MIAGFTTVGPDWGVMILQPIVELEERAQIARVTVFADPAAFVKMVESVAENAIRNAPIGGAVFYYDNDSERTGTGDCRFRQWQWPDARRARKSNPTLCEGGK